MEHARTNQIQKPVGVYILTICLFLRFGIFQFMTDFNSINDAVRETPFLIAIILISRDVFVIGAAIWAYLGENWGRISLLTIISLNVLWTIFTVTTYVSFNESGLNSIPIIFSLNNPIFWLVICWWYLNKKNVVKYYKRNESS